MMIILSKIRNNIDLHFKEKEIKYNLNKAIYRSPRPNKSFTVLRGVYIDPDFTIGDITVNENNTSGTFLTEAVLSGYTSEYSCILKIYIPVESILTYHPYEDQVIFPEKSEFKIINVPYIEKYIAFEDPTYEPTYDCIYIGPQ